MSTPKTSKDERTLLGSIDAKLSALLGLHLMANPELFAEPKNIKNMTAAVGFLASCGITDEEIGKVLGTSKDSARKMREKFKKSR